MPAHTPGPWWSDGGILFIGNGDDIVGLGHPGAMINLDDESSSRTESQVQADATLCAAAINLLAACKRFLTEAANDNDDSNGFVMRMLTDVAPLMRAAVAEAEAEDK